MFAIAHNPGALIRWFHCPTVAERGRDNERAHFSAVLRVSARGTGLTGTTLKTGITLASVIPTGIDRDELTVLDLPAGTLVPIVLTKRSGA